MCGCTKISGMARRKKRKSTGRRKSYRRRSSVGAMPDTSQVMAGVKVGATALAGFGLAGMLKNNITFLQTNPLIGNILQIAAGIATPMIIKNDVGTGLGIGMVAKGIQGFVVDNVPGIANTLGLSGLPDMYPTNSVLGMLETTAPMASVGNMSNENIMLKVR